MAQELLAGRACELSHDSHCTHRFPHKEPLLSICYLGDAPQCPSMPILKSWACPAARDPLVPASRPPAEVTTQAGPRCQSPGAEVGQGKPGILRTSGSPPGTYLEGKEPCHAGWLSTCTNSLGCLE